MYDLTDDEAKELAIHYHDTRCPLDHNDRCSWYWEMSGDSQGKPQHDWDRSTHARWLADVPKLLDKEMDRHPIVRRVENEARADELQKKLDGVEAIVKKVKDHFMVRSDAAALAAFIVAEEIEKAIQ